MVTMQINPIAMFINPKKTIDVAISKPDFKKAFIIVIIPGVLYVLFNLITGIPLDIFDIIKKIGASYFAWICISSSIYFFAFLVNTKDLKGKFNSIL
ncbi:MAG: hypothetical protein QXM75_02550, partial [Candidatus Diapherotrites archaeon]